MRSAKNTARTAERRKLCKRSKETTRTLSNQNVGGAADTEEAEEPPQQNGGHLLPVGVRGALGKSYG